MIGFLAELFSFANDQADPRGPKNPGCLMPALLVAGVLAMGWCWACGVPPRKKAAHKPAAHAPGHYHWWHRQRRLP